MTEPKAHLEIPEGDLTLMREYAENNTENNDEPIVMVKSPLISIALSTNDCHSVKVFLPLTIIIGRVMNRIIKTCISAALVFFSAGLSADDHASSSP